jgi:hypothetical protein
MTEKNFDRKEFFGDPRVKALEECIDEGYRPLFMPEIIDIKLMTIKQDRIWQVGYISQSTRIFGRGKSSNISHKGGTLFVVYAHVPNYLSDPENIKEAHDVGLVFASGIVPQAEFERLLDMEDGKNVFVLDYLAINEWNQSNCSKTGKFDVDQIKKNPEVVSFLGGMERTELYLIRHKEIFGDKFHNFKCCDIERAIPSGKSLGSSLCISSGEGRLYCSLLGGSGRFIGVRDKDSKPRNSGEIKLPQRISEKILKKLARQDDKNPEKETNPDSEQNPQINDNDKNGNCPWFL